MLFADPVSVDRRDPSPRTEGVRCCFPLDWGYAEPFACRQLYSIAWPLFRWSPLECSWTTKRLVTWCTPIACSLQAGYWDCFWHYSAFSRWNSSPPEQWNSATRCLVHCSGMVVIDLLWKRVVLRVYPQATRVSSPSCRGCSSERSSCWSGVPWRTPELVVSISPVPFLRVTL